MPKITITDIENTARPVLLTGEVAAGYSAGDVQRLVATGFASIQIEEPAPVKAAKE